MLVRATCPRVTYRLVVWFLVARIVAGTFLRVQQHEVHLGTEQESQGHTGAHCHAHHQAGDLDLNGRTLLNSPPNFREKFVKGENVPYNRGWSQRI